MKNKKKLGFLTAALATAFVAGCSDEVTNADRSFSDDRDYYVPFIPGEGYAENVVFESDTVVLDGRSYLDCEKLNPDAIYVTLKYENSDNWVIAEAINGGNFCLATTGGAGVVSGQGEYFHFIPDGAGGAQLAKLKQDTLVEGGSGFEYPPLAAAWGNDEIVEVQVAASVAALDSEYVVLQHPSDPGKNIYRGAGGALFQPATGTITLDCAFCAAVAVLETDEILVARNDSESFPELFPNAQTVPTSNLALHSASGAFIGFVPPKFAIPVSIEDFPGRHHASGLWLTGRGQETGNLIRFRYSDASNQAWLESTLGTEEVALGDINGAFDGAGNFWVVGDLGGEASIYKHSLDGVVSKISGFSDAIQGASLTLSSETRLVSGGK